MAEPIKEGWIVEAVNHVTLLIVASSRNRPSGWQNISTKATVKNQLEAGLEHVIVSTIQLVQEENSLIENDDLGIAFVLMTLGARIGNLAGKKV